MRKPREPGKFATDIIRQANDSESADKHQSGDRGRMATRVAFLRSLRGHIRLPEFLPYRFLLAKSPARKDRRRTNFPRIRFRDRLRPDCLRSPPDSPPQQMFHWQSRVNVG